MNQMPFLSPRSLSDLGNRSENSAGRGQILSILKVNSCSIDQESGEIWTVQTDLQQIYPKSDRLLVPIPNESALFVGSSSAPQHTGLYAFGASILAALTVSLI
jgi:hypothetical protein